MQPIKYLAIEINSWCNRKCSWCPNSLYERPVEHMPMEMIDHILSQCRGAMECTYNNFNEPLLDERLPDIVALSRRWLGAGCKLYVNTNGDMLTLGLYKELKRAGLNDFNITDYDGSSKIDFHYVNPVKAVPMFNRGGLLGKTAAPLVKDCSKPRDTLTIEWTGQVVLCCADFLGQVPCGHVSEQSIEQIWNGPVFQEYRRCLPNRAGLKLCEACDGP